MIIEDIAYLTCADDITEYFKDCGHELFNCGQGYYEDEITRTVKIRDQYFSVTISAEVLGHRQDRGDKLYVVEDITSVVYHLISTEEVREQTLAEHVRIVAEAKAVYDDANDALVNYLVATAKEDLKNL